jgi:hypothetical protein
LVANVLPAVRRYDAGLRDRSIKPWSTWPQLIYFSVKVGQRQVRTCQNAQFDSRALIVPTRVLSSFAARGASVWLPARAGVRVLRQEIGTVRSDGGDFTSARARVARLQSGAADLDGATVHVDVHERHPR